MLIESVTDMVKKAIDPTSVGANIGRTLGLKISELVT